MKNSVIPRWILMYAALLAIFAFAMGGWTWLASDNFLSSMGTPIDGDGKDMILYLFAARNLAFGTIFTVALLLFRRRDVFLTIFAGRFVVDLFDTLGIYLVGRLNAVAIISQLVMFLIPLTICIYQLWQINATNEIEN